ncbi:MAG: hypothetical protein JST22_19510 [Bacteroidetes bacterium]|nr:hypothetical protein [Bacteroidota bacterium]
MNHQRWQRPMAVMLMMLAASMAVHAQERRLPGAVVLFGVAYDMGFVVPADAMRSNTSLTSDSKLKSAGISLILPKLFGNGFGLSTTWSYGISNIRIDAQGTESNYQGRYPTEPAEVHQTLDFQARTIQGDIMAYIQAGDLVRLEIGPHASIGFLPHYTASETIVSPSTATFNDGSQYWQQTSSGDPNVFVATGGLGIRASLEIPLTPGLALVPSAQARASAVYSNAEVEHYNFKRNVIGGMGSLGIGLGVIFGSTNGELIPAPPPAATPPAATPPATTPKGPATSERTIDTLTAPVPPALHARVELFCQDRNGNRTDTFLLSPRRTLHRMHVPLVPVLYFEPNSSSLPERYAGYTTATRSAFTMKAIAGANVADLYRYGLNIIGMRMAADPSASIAITGSAAPAEPKRIARERAEAVRNYLASTWGIDRSRLHVMPPDGSRGEGDRIVAIASASQTITAPIVTEWIEESVDAPSVLLQPTIIAAAGVRSWKATVTHNGHQIGVLSAHGGEPEGSIDAGMVLRDFNEGNGTQALSAELLVEDSTGAMAMARDTLPVVLDTGNVTTGRRAMQTVSQHVLPIASAEETNRSIRNIVAGINKSASIQVTPYVWGSQSVDSSAIGRRLEFIGNRLRSECSEEGKRITSFDVRGESVAIDGASPEHPAPHELAAPIEVMVIEEK